jgi:hypothetical protein
MIVDAELIKDGEPLGEISFDRDDPPKELYILDCAETTRCVYKLVKTEKLPK